MTESKTASYAEFQFGFVIAAITIALTAGFGYAAVLAISFTNGTRIFLRIILRLGVPHGNRMLSDDAGCLLGRAPFGSGLEQACN